MNKKIILNLLTGLCAVLFLANCSGDAGGDEGPSLTVSPSSVTLAATGNEQTSIKVESNSSWEVTKDANASWLTIGTSRGTKNGSFNIWATDNTGSEAQGRSATITISVSRSDYYKTVTVKQPASNNQPELTTSLKVNKNDLSFSASGGNDSFTITSNTSWTVSCDQSWCTLSPTSGSNNGTITVKTEENKSTTSRSANITIKYGDKSETVMVRQAAAEAFLTVSPTSLSFTESGGSENISITSNTNWTVSSNQTWCTVSPTSGSNNGTVTIKVDENKNTTERSAIITVKYGDKSITIPVTQTGTDVQLTVSPTSLSFTENGGSENISITSNTSWIVSSNQSWCTVSPTSGSNNGTVTIRVDENKNTTTRSAIITIKYGDKSITISVSQKAAPVLLTVSPTSLSFKESGGSEKISITSNTNWTVSSNQSWCKISPASGSNNGTVTVTASTNDSNSERSAKITIKDTKNSVAIEVSVTQATKTEGSSVGRNDYDGDINMDNK
jgi:hypothetical protein